MIPSLQQRLDTRKRPNNRSAVMYQSWKNLLFLHWEVDPEEIQATLPSGLTVDTFEGKAYLGIVPFYMQNVRPRFLPTIPGISDFLETNIRTYVYDQRGRPGVWFYSLDANQKLAVRLARKFFHLPYIDAKMEAPVLDDVIHYQTKQADSSQASQFHYSLGSPSPNSPELSPDSLDFFLLERYYLFAYCQKKQQLYSGQVHHTPYPVNQVELIHHSVAPSHLAGFSIDPSTPAHIHASSRVDVEVYPLERV